MDWVLRQGIKTVEDTDLLTGATGNDTVVGATGNDTVVGGTSTTQTQADKDALEYAAQQQEAADNVTDLGNGPYRVSDGRIFDSAGNLVSANTSNNTTYTADNWPTIIYGSTGTDGEQLTTTTTSDGTPFYLDRKSVV